MISLVQKLQDDTRIALKNKDTFALGVLRMVIAAVQNKKIEKRGRGSREELTDDEARDVLSKEMKKRHDAIALYEQGGRADLAEQEKKEAKFIQKYLPVQLSREEIEEKVEKIMANLQYAKSNSALQFGNTMRAVIAELKGIADAKIVSEIIKQKIGVP